MTAIATAASKTGDEPRRSSASVAGALWHTWAMTRRNLIHISRAPMQLSDVTIQPLVFTLLFVYIFGSGIPIPGGGRYVDYVLAGVLVLNLVSSTTGTAVGLSTDLHEGMMDRFRTLPMWRSAILVGRSLADLLTALLCALIVALTGLALGWRPETSIASIIAGFALMLFFSYAVSWVSACLGLNADNPETAASFGLILLLPLTFVSNAIVPTQNMPGWLQTITTWNPVSSVVAATRTLWGNPNPSHTIHAWPMQHPIPAALIWSTLILVIAAPAAIGFFKRKTTQ
ncbi:ABC transporter permease [Nocardia australiensis]|uniref:ABC transporter permease n=1 Tax=Nocardia australiensis TaxID=2887191 RepID=UPI001D14AE3B|nr:ABC transporter permease [Nocardia australiensis]